MKVTLVAAFLVGAATLSACTQEMQNKVGRAVPPLALTTISNVLIATGMVFLMRTRIFKKIMGKRKYILNLVIIQLAIFFMKTRTINRVTVKI